MRLHIEGKDTTIVPHLMGRIAERLEQLNEVHDDILEARFTLLHQGSLHEARVRLLLAGKTLYATQQGDSPDAAVGAALGYIEDALYAQRALQRRHLPTAMYSPQNAAPLRKAPQRHTTAKKTVW
jgi:ribosome-associated translation inhibitor RaiA